MFNDSRIKISKERNVPFIQLHPYVDYLTTEENIKKSNKSVYR